MNKILITAKANPDIDGTACMLAYADLLRQSGQEAEALVFGTPHVEAQYFIAKHGLTVPARPDDGRGDYPQTILVDASSMKGMPKVIQPGKVVEIIDHREGDLTPGEFPNARIQNELVGAAATLIVEKFIVSGKLPQPQHAKVLYGAIFDNTLNFLSSNTNQRDRQAAEWLKNKFELDDSIVAEMFEFAVKATMENIRAVLESDYKTFPSPHGDFVCCQLVIWDNDLASLESEITKTLNDLNTKTNSKWGFLSAIDLHKRRNVFFAPDALARETLTRALGIVFSGNWGTLEPVILRKQIVPRIKALI